MQPGDAITIADLIACHGSALVLYARGLCDCPDDVVQEAFMKLIAQKQMPEHPAAWLFRVVRNLALNSSRSVARRRKHEQGKAIECQNWFEANSADRILAAEAVVALGQLESMEREIVVARIWGQLSFEEIAELAKCSLSTAHRRYTAALTTLNEKLLLPSDRIDQSPKQDFGHFRFGP